MQTALKLSEEDQQTIIALKKEIEKAWKLVDSSHEKVSASLGHTMICYSTCCRQVYISSKARTFEEETHFA